MKFAFALCAALLLAPLSVKAQQPTPVYVTEVSYKPFADEIEALGTLQANENVNLTSSVTERVVKINFDSGDRVKKGDILVEMDLAEEEARRDEEKSVLAEAERQVARLTPLVERGATSKSALDEATLKLQTAKARIAAIESQINERKIRAPFDGRLGLRNISIGIMAQPGTLITTIDEDSVMKLDFSVPEVYLPVLKEGGKIESTAKAFPNEIFSGTVATIDSRVDPVTRSISVRALLDNADYKLRPGMLMRVKLQKNLRQALVLPEDVIVPRGDSNFVFVVVGDDNDDAKTVSMRPVELGARRKGEVEILGGIEEGQHVVMHGTLRVQDGAKVKVTAVAKGHETLQELMSQKSEGQE